MTDFLAPPTPGTTQVAYVTTPDRAAVYLDGTLLFQTRTLTVADGLAVLRALPNVDLLTATLARRGPLPPTTAEVVAQEREDARRDQERRALEAKLATVKAQLARLVTPPDE